MKGRFTQSGVATRQHVTGCAAKFDRGGNLQGGPSRDCCEGETTRWKKQQYGKDAADEDHRSGQLPNEPRAELVLNFLSQA